MKKIERIKDILSRIDNDSLLRIKQEIKDKELLLISLAEKGEISDKTCEDSVFDYLKLSKNPPRPKNLNELMVQFIGSAFSYNRIRIQMRKIHRERFGNPDFPIKSEHKKILSYIFNDQRLNDDFFWHPERLGILMDEIESRGDYNNPMIITPYWLGRIMSTLLTAPKRIMEITGGDISAFYKKIDEMCNDECQGDIFEKSKRLWNFAKEISVGVKNVGPNLVCDFLKESGFTAYAKMDVHLMRSMGNFLHNFKDEKLDDFESFVTAQWFADKIGMTPYRFDKILFVWGIQYPQKNKKAKCKKETTQCCF